ncbi:fasciclin domain-containing protein [Limnoglobus roseus]|uniref:Beta-Ig-H3/fasciclin n=1 Tax=Limnoglobus roseus TaxID=2598579 RepID=A0A5C1ANC5_9BACT|nr:fasciclin domain-containing protein [Limnoglobus roseus]QEL20490.1 beta-Ig-H3/fasciclin [Limnoglobus roseus]
MLADKEQLKTVLMANPVVGKAVLAADALKMDRKEVNGLKVCVDGTAVNVGDARVILTDIKAGNGVIHTTGAVLMPKD